MLETGIKAPEFTLPDQNGNAQLNRLQREKGYFIFLPKR